MKTLALVAGWKDQPSFEEMLHMEKQDIWPRESLFYAALNADRLDEHFLEHNSRAIPIVGQILPLWFRQITEAHRKRHGYDAVISWAEHLGISFAGLLKMSGQRIPHVVIFSWISRPKKAVLLKRVHSHIDRIILASSVQREFAIKKLGIPPSKLVALKWRVDHKFWRPAHAEGQMICSAGREMRDYKTLVEALWNTPFKCHIAAGGQTGGKKDAWIHDIESLQPLPSHITLGPLDFKSLRSLYSRSKFLVMPLFGTDTDNGATTILEAMSMEKAVICSKVEGQIDIIEEGKTGLYVTPGNPRALRAAIEYLWNNPEIAQAMGKEGRKYIEKHHSMEAFASGVRQQVEEAIDENKRKLVKQGRP